MTLRYETSSFSVCDTFPKDFCANIYFFRLEEQVSSGVMVSCNLKQLLYGLKIAKRPARAKALIINAFALAGRIVFGGFFTSGRCPGLCASAPSGRAA